MKTAQYSALGLVVALVLYVGSLGPFVRYHGITENRFDALGWRVYQPLLVFRWTPVETALDAYVRLWEPAGSRSVAAGPFTVLDCVELGCAAK